MELGDMVGEATVAAPLSQQIVLEVRHTLCSGDALPRPFLRQCTVDSVANLWQRTVQSV